MTIHFPDVSRYNRYVNAADYPALIAKATMSDGTHGNIDESDPTYTGYKADAQAAGTLFVAYHWLNHGNLKAQAAHCFSVVGRGTPLMIDAEDVSGNTGYNGPLTVGDITGFATEYRALGGTVSLAYLSQWYWSGHMNGPNLTPLNHAGLHLVSSHYTTYSDTGPGWNGYGGINPVQWQYTDAPVDMNAFRGTLGEYAALVNPVQNESMTKGEEMFLAIDKPTGRVYLCDGIHSRWLPTEQSLIDVQKTLVNEGWITLENNGAVREGWNEAAFGTLVTSGTGLTDVDRALLQSTTDAVNSLNSRLASP